MSRSSPNKLVAVQSLYYEMYEIFQKKSVRYHQMKCLTTQGDVWLLRQIWNESICIHRSLTLLKSFKFQTISGKIHVIHVKKNGLKLM